MPTPLRIGFVGAGGNTIARHLPLLQALPDVQFVSVANRTRESGAKVAAQFGIAKVAAHWQEVVQDPEVDAVVIGTWPYLHCPVTCAALDAGKHVLCEARMAMNAAEARQMLATSRRHPELVAQVVPSPFTLKYDRAIQETLAAGRLGELVAVDIRATAGAFADFAAPRTWRQDTEMSGLNILTMGIWYEAMARWVGHATRVQAMTQVVVRQRPVPGQPGRAAITVPDHVDVLAQLASGAQARLQCSAVTGLAPHANQAWLFGTTGTLCLDADGDRLLIGQRGDKSLAPLPIPADWQGAWRVEAEFVNAIRGLEPIRLTTFADGLRYMEFTDAVARSSASGHAVSLPLLG